jgi:hypothetical protein
LLAPLTAQTAQSPESQIQPGSQIENVQAPPDDASTPASTPANATPYASLTLGENYLWTLNRVFSPSSMFVYSVHAAFDQALQKPAPWGDGMAAYALRSANILGRSFVRQNVAFGVRAFDHEDPRYFPMGRGSKWNRVKYAMERTFIVPNTSGGNMPAYSLFVSSFATPYIADIWRPGKPHPLRAGAASLGFAVGADVFREFWPDLRKKLDIEGRLHRYDGH